MMYKLAKFKDSITHPTKNSICLLTVISVDQEYQQGESFKAFCHLLSQEYELNKSINKLIVVETGYLKRHYIRLNPKLNIEEATAKAKHWGAEWVKKHKLYLEKLPVPYEVKSWEEIIRPLTNTNEINFSNHLNKIKNDYEKEDDRLKDLVNALSRNYAFKLVDEWEREGIKLKFDTCFQAAKNYLIEEGAIIFELIKLGADYITYPDRSNPVLKYIYKKYLIETDPLPWKRYQVINMKEFDDCSNVKNTFNSTHFSKLQESISTTLTHVCYNWDDGQFKNFYKGFVTLVSNIDNKV
jgi:hypothetical protein